MHIYIAKRPDVAADLVWGGHSCFCAFETDTRRRLRLEVGGEDMSTLSKSQCAAKCWVLAIRFTFNFLNT